MEIKRTKGCPSLYVQLADCLREDIEKLVFPSDSLLPSEKELAEKYSVSRITVRQALALLASKNYVKAQQGIGTRVIFQKPALPPHIAGLSLEMERRGQVLCTNLCSMALVSPSREVQKALYIKEGEKCYRLRRLRELKGLPLVYTESFLRRLKPLPLDREYYEASLYTFLRNKNGLVIRRAKDSIEAIRSGKRLARLLGIPPGDPVLLRTRQGFLPNGLVFEYSKSYFAGARYRHRLRIGE